MYVATGCALVERLAEFEDDEIVRYDAVEVDVSTGRGDVRHDRSDVRLDAPLRQQHQFDVVLQRRYFDVETHVSELPIIHLHVSEF